MNTDFPSLAAYMEWKRDDIERRTYALTGLTKRHTGDEWCHMCFGPCGHLAGERTSDD
jgi:hypothetical protein